MRLDLGVGHGPAKRPRQKPGQQPPRVLLGVGRHDAQVLRRLLRIGRLERQLAVEQPVAPRRPLLPERAGDLHPLHDGAEAVRHHLVVGRLGHHPKRRQPERLALGNSRHVFELAKLRRAHLEVGPLLGHAGPRPVGEPRLEHDPPVGPRGIGRPGVGARLVDHRAGPDPEAIPFIRHWRRPRAKLAVRAVAAVPADREQALGRARPLVELESRRAPVVPGFGVVGADRAGLGPRRGHGGLGERQRRRLEIPLEVHRREFERLADRVEAAGRAILGQQVGERRVDAQKIVDRRHVFGAVEPAPHRAALAGLEESTSHLEPAAERVEEHRPLFARRPFLVRRRHLAAGHAVVHLRPPGEGLRVVGLPAERRRVEAALLRIGVVASDAVPLEERLPHGRAGVRGGLAPGRDGREPAGRQKEKKEQVTATKTGEAVKLPKCGDCPLFFHGPDQARSSGITRAWVTSWSVRLSGRPSCSTVSSRWSMPSRWSSVAWRSWNRMMPSTA